MEQKFTSKSQEVINSANMNAQTAGNPSIEPAHLLKALMDQREGVAAAVLKAAGVDVDAVSVAASNEIAKLPKSSGSSVAGLSEEDEEMLARQGSEFEFLDDLDR